MPPSKRSDNTCLRAGSKDRMGRWVSAGGRSLTRSMGMTVLSCLQGTCGRKARQLSLLEGDLHQEASLPSATDRWKPLSHHSLSTEEVPGKYVWLPDPGSPGGRGKGEGGRLLAHRGLPSTSAGRRSPGRRPAEHPLCLPPSRPRGSQGTALSLSSKARALRARGRLGRGGRCRQDVALSAFARWGVPAGR